MEISKEILRQFTHTNSKSDNISLLFNYFIIFLKCINKMLDKVLMSFPLHCFLMGLVESVTYFCQN